VTSKKTLQQRQSELQSLLSTHEGKEQLRRLESYDQAASGKLRPARTSLITFLLVHEREAGLIGL
jgi:hypothetical protein